MIVIKRVSSKKEIKAFVKFPFSLYSNSKYWVPPIINQELTTFNPKKNPIFNDAEATFLLAYKDGKLVGRVAAIVNWLEVKKQNVKKMRFGWFDFIDDYKVSEALINEVINIGKSHNLEFIEGPVGFSNLDKVGVLTQGFDAPNNMVTWYNYPYYVKHYEALNMQIEKSYSESVFKFNMVNPETFNKAQILIRKRYNLKTPELKNSKDVLKYADQMFDLFNTSYSSLSSFVEITDIQKAYFKKKFLTFVDPKLVKFVFDKNDRMIAFAIVLPRFTEALQAIKGKLFPFGFLKILDAKKHSKDMVFYLIGVHPEYQNKGVNAVIFHEYYTPFNERGVINCYRTPELEDNEAIHNIWKRFDPVVFKRRKTFRKDI